MTCDMMFSNWKDVFENTTLVELGRVAQALFLIQVLLNGIFIVLCMRSSPLDSNHALDSNHLIALDSNHFSSQP